MDRDDQPHRPSRRALLKGIAGAAATIGPGMVRRTAVVQSTRQPTSAIPIIDTHIHLFDPTRPQGAPYTGPPGVPTEPALPPRYRRLAAPLGIVGAIKIEASRWVKDNLWVLEVAARDTIIVGVVGNLEPRWWVLSGATLPASRALLPRSISGRSRWQPTSGSRVTRLSPPVSRS